MVVHKPNQRILLIQVMSFVEVLANGHVVWINELTVRLIINEAEGKEDVAGGLVLEC